MVGIHEFLSNPLVGLIGYILSMVAAIIAITQYLGKSSAQKEIFRLRLEITSLTEENFTLNSTLQKNNTIRQGDKSQYFQDNSGAINIDNRG